MVHCSLLDMSYFWLDGCCRSGKVDGEESSEKVEKEEQLILDTSCVVRLLRKSSPHFALFLKNVNREQISSNRSIYWNEASASLLTELYLF
ncbi:hypothetical protein TELCIR_23946 [Teladorsagia circumcincta]|uniref:Uncharacterized protein n=1 Tax=Teladorsagia circumcincta TaxID=45464 RepID=A0A2G9T9R9_TELCI|nr:hypothetical protein TELCIR_23946 [Teladorsagia circumcincta]